MHNELESIKCIISEKVHTIIKVTNYVNLINDINNENIKNNISVIKGNDKYLELVKYAIAAIKKETKDTNYKTLVAYLNSKEYLRDCSDNLLDYQKVDSFSGDDLYLLFNKKEIF